MKKLGIFTAFTTAMALSSSVALAADDANMEKCKVMKDGKNIIKEHKSDCKTGSHSCAGHNKAGEAEAWIMVPKGQCDKVNAGDFSGLSKEQMDKLETK